MNVENEKLSRENVGLKRGSAAGRTSDREVLSYGLRRLLHTLLFEGIICSLSLGIETNPLQHGTVRHLER